MLIPIGDGQAFHAQGRVVIDAERHTALFGKSGTGKSTMLGNIASTLMRAGWGFTLLDPHSDLADHVLSQVPRDRVRDVCWIDPMDAYPLPLNIFHGTDDRRAIDNLSAIVWGVWPSGRGPRSEWILENACRALLSLKRRPSVLQLFRFLARSECRQKVRARVTEPDLLDFFHTLEDEWDRRQREEALAPLLNKLSRFVSDPRLRDMMCQQSSLDFAELMDKRRIVICRLPKGALGSASSVIGSTIVAKIVSAALERERQPLVRRVPHALILDEVQAFTHGVSLDVLLSELRKYKVTVIVGTQTIGGLPEGSEQAVFGNCSTLVSFRPSGADAKEIATEFAGEFPPSALVGLANGEAYVKTVRDGLALEPARVKCYPPVKGTGLAKTGSVLSWSRTKYGKPREQVSQAILKALGGAI